MIFIDSETRIYFEDAIRNLAQDGRNPQQVKQVFEEILMYETLGGTFKGVNQNASESR